jgi:hypothetical protein
MHFDNSKKYLAEVIDNDDSLKLGRVKIFIEHIMVDWNKQLLPWAFQYTSMGGSSSTYGSSFIPEKGSKVWVWFEDDDNFINPFYIDGPTFEELSIHKKYDSIKSNMSELSGGYPNNKFIHFANGINIGVCTSNTNKEIWIYHSSNTYINIDNDGKVTIKSNKKLILDFADEGLEITGDVIIKEGELKVDKEVTAMNETPAAKVTLSMHTHTSGAPGAPTSTPTPGA